MTRYITRLDLFVDGIIDCIYRDKVPMYADIDIKFAIMDEPKGRSYGEMIQEPKTEYGLRTVGLNFGFRSCLLVGDKIGGGRCRSVEIEPGEQRESASWAIKNMIADIVDERLSSESIILAFADDEDWFEKFAG